MPGLSATETLFVLADSPLEVGQLAVLQLRGLRVVTRTLRLLDFETHVLELFLQASRALNRFFFVFPMRCQAVSFFFEVGQLPFEPGEPLQRGFIRLLA